MTFDNSDWIFACVYADARGRQDAKLAGRVRDAYVPYMESIVEFFEKRAVEVVGREIPQTLLIHANRLNAEMAPRLLAMLKRRGGAGAGFRRRARRVRARRAAGFRKASGPG